MVQQTPEERVRRNRESTLVEEREGDDIAVGRRRRLLMAKHEPLCYIGPLAKKTTLDEALHTCICYIGVMP